jgi:hypothetical protein
MTLDFTTQELDRILGEASAAATIEATEFFNDRLNGVDQYACGFAWVDIYGIRANSKLGKQLAGFGIKKDSWKKCHSVWDPAGLNVQNIDIKEAGADAFARVLESYGFKAYAGSRLD